MIQDNSRIKTGAEGTVLFVGGAATPLLNSDNPEFVLIGAVLLIVLMFVRLQVIRLEKIHGDQKTTFEGVSKGDHQQRNYEASEPILAPSPTTRANPAKEKTESKAAEEAINRG